MLKTITINVLTHKVVPIEPTNEMLQRARHAPIPSVMIDSISGQIDLRNGATYKEMLAATPAPEGI